MKKLHNLVKKLHHLVKNLVKELDSRFRFWRPTFVIFACIAVIFIILKAPQMIDASEIRQFNRDLQNYNVKLQVINENGEDIAEFSVAVADTDYKKMYGLMNLNRLPKDHGMLFPFFRSQVIMMWMKNTRIPLDMLFIDNDNVIVNIKTNAVPYSLEMISSEKEVNKVLEINAHAVSRLGIKVGQKVRILD